MVVTLTGSNNFGIQSELDTLVGDFIQKYGEFSVEHIDGEDTEFELIQQAIDGLPFLSVKKLVVLRVPSKNKKFVEKIEQTFTNKADSTDVILIEPKLDKRLAYYKFLKSQTIFHELKALDSHGLSQWLTTRAKNQNGRLELSAARFLVERVGEDQQLLAQELDKVMLYSNDVTKEVIILLTDETPQSTIFQLLEAAFSGQTSVMLRLYNEQRALNVEPRQFIAMLTWQLHVLALVKTSDNQSLEQVASKAKLNPYSLRKSYTIADRLSLRTLKSLISRLLTLDIKLKSVSIDPDEALTHFLMSIALL